MVVFIRLVWLDFRIFFNVVIVINKLRLVYDLKFIFYFWVRDFEVENNLMKIGENIGFGIYKV